MPTYLSPGVYIEEQPAGSRPIEGVGTAVAAFIGQTEQGPKDEPTLVTNWGQFVASFGEITETGYTPLSVYNYFNNGGGACYIVRVGGDDGASADEQSSPTAELTSALKAGQASYKISARSASDRSDLSVAVTTQPAAEGDDSAELFTLTVKQGGKDAETHKDLSARKGKQNAVTVIAERSKLILLEAVGSANIAERFPVDGEYPLVSQQVATTAMELDSSELVGDVSARSGLGSLEAIEGVTMVAIPDLMAAYQQGHLDLSDVQVVQQALIDHCEDIGDRMAILDTPPDLNAQQVKAWRVDETGYDSKFAAMYWPWIEVFNPIKNETELVPPSAAMAGIWARSDATRGVHKAPANEVVRGTVGLAQNITRAEHDQLNPVGINVIRSFSGRGIRVWGARTLSSDAEWRYLNVRRLFNYMESSILDGTQWVVFEPNDLELWQRIKRTINGFLTNTWREGALFGATPADAFYVKCDEQTNPPDSVEAGRVVIEIGVCPVKPAEFVVFRLSQFAAGGASDEG